MVNGLNGDERSKMPEARCVHCGEDSERDRQRKDSHEPNLIQELVVEQVVACFVRSVKEGIVQTMVKLF